MNNEIKAGYNARQNQKAVASEVAYQQFISHLDGIFYEGYADQLARQDASQFTNELNLFLNTYSHAGTR